mmetsp:Transcript_52621/g.114188  ORF Transcript_52621/g.114188 Transcript_52621/m.114188 type:complete len:241 (+) Transcript_52621:412-1134(+)
MTWTASTPWTSPSTSSHRATPSPSLSASAPPPQAFTASNSCSTTKHRVATPQRARRESRTDGWSTDLCDTRRACWSTRRSRLSRSSALPAAPSTSLFSPSRSIPCERRRCFSSDSSPASPSCGPYSPSAPQPGWTRVLGVCWFTLAHSSLSSSASDPLRKRAFPTTTTPPSSTSLSWSRIAVLTSPSTRSSTSSPCAMPNPSPLYGPAYPPPTTGRLSPPPPNSLCSSAPPTGATCVSCT